MAFMRESKPFVFIYCSTRKKANDLSAKTISKRYFMEGSNPCNVNSVGELA